MKCLRALLATLLFALLATTYALAQTSPSSNCIDNTLDPYDPNPPCNQILLTNLHSGDFHATPFIDSQPVNGMWPDYGDPGHNTVSLYGAYGNNEKTSTSGAAQAHYTQGVALANQITPLCTDGSTSNPCPDGQPQSIVFLFIGFSNTDIEIGGGNSDVWDGLDGNTNLNNHYAGHLFGQPCSTKCENLNNPDGVNAWNQVTMPAVRWVHPAIAVVPGLQLDAAGGATRGPFQWRARPANPVQVGPRPKRILLDTPELYV